MTMSMPRGAARSQIVARAPRMAGRSGSPSSNTPPPTLIFSIAELGADLQHPVVHRLGGAALLAVEVPVQQELELDVADAVVGEDAAHGRQAVPGDRSLHVVEHETHAAPADPPRDLGAILQGKGADLARCARIDGAADRPVGRAEVDVFDLHLSSLGDAVWGRPAELRWPAAMLRSVAPFGARHTRVRSSAGRWPFRSACRSRRRGRAGGR